MRVTHTILDYLVIFGGQGTRCALAMDLDEACRPILERRNRECSVIW